MKFITARVFAIFLPLFLTAPGALRAAATVTLQAPVTLTATFTLSGPETQRTIGTSTSYQARLITFKFGNKEMISSMFEDGEIDSIAGWSLVARWTAGDTTLDDYQLYVVKTGRAPVPIDDTDNSLDLHTETFVAGYSEKWTGGFPVSGSGTFQSGITMNLTDTGDTINLGGIAAGSYSIRVPVKGVSPAYIPAGIKMTLLGGATLDGHQTVVNLTMTIGTPTVVTK